MFDSGVLVKDLVEELKNTEIDIALDIPNATYVSWLNSVQQLLYTEVIKEQNKIVLDATITPNPIDIAYLSGNKGENEPRFATIRVAIPRTEFRMWVTMG